ncbi:class I SAM-dependent RNA methyltransferase [Luteimicrobium subarcticum]|uniref:23S rRNA m(5)U-1939 methyltransferase n=1 Tax=Luteimicrobium subarcticum TaxID=620910 RepID=A0A2M8W462_9MICO|nr:TRAM domain-containing protein [Luteimicrobium subarcticum]PJI85698.1 23S rRNA m(5)U-1939 methyltransferase [Luteimicrobium subarcticum]
MPSKKKSRPSSRRPSGRGDASRAARPNASAPPDLPPVELEVGPVAHGGHCVARHEGRVVFVRHALPGERVLARLTSAEDDARFWRADAVEVLEASPDRVPSAWPAAGPGGVGGGELAHVALAAQRRWKQTVLAEQLERLAGVTEVDGVPVAELPVAAAPGDDERGGLGWRTRIELVTDAQGRAGMHRYRSHDVVPLDDMPLASDEVRALCETEGVFTRLWPAGVRLDVIAPADGSAPLLLQDGEPLRGGRTDERPNARRTVTETVALPDGRTGTYRLRGDGFWQVHRAAPAVLVGAVLDALAGTGAGATVLDLYSGAGLFTAPLADLVGPAGRVVAVEGSEQAVKDARRSLHDVRQVELHAGRVETTLTALRAAAGSSGGLRAADAVVLDPPRAGAGRQVVEQVAHLAPATIVYVACDPAALARDVAYLADQGYRLAALRAFDLFPMTHHVEAVATFVPAVER